MFINKISSGVPKTSFKSLQHEIDNRGNAVMRFNYVFDYTNKNAYVEFFKVKKNNDAQAGYEVITDAPISRIKLEKNGTQVNLDDITNLDRDEAFAYRIVVDGEAPIADSGIKLNNEGYTLVTRTGTTPRIQGAGYLAYPDAQRVGVKYRDFNHPNTGEIYIDKTEQMLEENEKRHFSKKSNGNLAGLEYNLDYLAQNGYKIQPTNPIAGGDNKASHHYWNKNNFQISDDMGNTENFKSYARKLFQKGILQVYDATFTSEGLEGIHFQYAMRWADKNPQTYYWFKMQGLKNSNLGLGVIPKNDKNLRHRVINAPYIYDETTKSIIENKNYNPDKETYFQIYDASQVSDEQLAKLDEPIENYQKIKSGDFNKIVTHDDTLINYIFEISPKEYTDRLHALKDFNKNNSKPITANSPEGTVFIGQFSNFKMDYKNEGGFVTWDANTDMVKMNYQNSVYDEKINLSIENSDEREYDKKMREIGAYEVQDMALQAGKYWTRFFKKAQTNYTAQVLKGAKTPEKINQLIENGLLPKEGKLTNEAIENILKGEYKLEPKGVLDKDDATVKALMDLPLDALEFAENTVGVLSTSYFSNRATSEDTLGMTRFELMKKENPHLIKPYKKAYIETNLFYSNDIKNFADEIIKKINETSTEKLLDENDNYTEYGEYVIEQMGASIAKYAFLKSLTGKDLKTKILPNGEITYDYKDIKSRTSLKSLGINASNPQDEVYQLQKLIKNGLENLNKEDINYVAESISKRIAGTNIFSYRLAEAIVRKAGLGLAMRLDAAKDLVDQDAVRNGEIAFDENWQALIHFWKKYVEAVKSENPDAYIVAELTDIGDLMANTLGEAVGTYDNLPDTGLKYKRVQDAMVKFFNETGITSEAAYSYFFTDMQKVFGPDYTNGETFNDTNYRCNKIINNLHDLIQERGVDFVRNLYTFVGNHDKPRVIQGLALDMKLFHGDFNVYNQDGVFNKDLNRNNRLEAMLQLTNSDSYNDLPLEAKMNIDNPEYFNTACNYAIAMSQLLRNSMNDSLNNIASSQELQYLKSALVDLTNGNYLESGKTTQIPSINIPELSSLDSALREIIKLSGLSVSEKEIQEILKKANNQDIIEQYTVQGDFDWGGTNANIGERNQKMAETVLRGAYENVPSGEIELMKYSPYTTGVAALLRHAIIDVKGNNANDRYCLLNACKEFMKKYDRATVEANQTKLPFEESYEEGMAKKGFASQDIKDAIEMLINQAEFKARKDGVLAENEHFTNRQDILLNVWKSATEPAVQKMIMMMTFLSAMVGIPTLYGGDELGLSGYDEKTKNVYLKCRNPLPWLELENSIFKDFREKIQKNVNDAMKIRSREGVEALNNGTAYKMKTSNDDIPAFLMQDGFGNMTVSVFNATDVDVNSRFDYFKKYGITKENKKQFFAENGIESINPNNRFVPIQRKKDLDYIELGAGISLPLGLVFLNTDTRDKAEYIIDKIREKSKEGKELIKLALVKKGGGKISLNSFTAKNGAMVLKHVAFKSNTQHIKQYNIVSNPYQKMETTNKGEKLSILAK